MLGPGARQYFVVPYTVGWRDSCQAASERDVTCSDSIWRGGVGQQERGRSGVSSDISVCDCGVCSDHYDDNDDVGFNVAVITHSGITLFQTQEALIFAIRCGGLGNNASLF